MKIQKSTAVYDIPFLMVLASDHVSPATGLAPTVTLRKNGGSFGAAAGAVTEIANGWYSLAGDAGDSDTLGGLVLHAEAATADNADDLHEVVIEDLASATIAEVTTVTSLTNAPTAGDLTATMKSSVATAAAAAISAAEPIEANVTEVAGHATSAAGGVTFPASIAGTTTVMSADVKKINGTTINGDGSGTPFGP